MAEKRSVTMNASLIGSEAKNTQWKSEYASKTPARFHTWA